MGRLDGRVAIVTGAGRGLGRAHALALAAQGARVVVNDLGANVHGEGADPTPAWEVVERIHDFGGEAVASGHDVSDWTQARALIEFAVDTFGDLHVLVNNAGIIRDRHFPNMEESEWDAVVRVHLKGHAAPSRHACTYWKERAKAGVAADRSVIMTSSIAGFAGNFGQANYSAAKLAVVALARVVAIEMARYGVRANAVSPGARTRIALAVPGAAEELAAVGGQFDPFDPANVSPLIVWLAAADCPATSQVLHLTGSELIVSTLPPVLDRLRVEGRWSLDDFDKHLTPRLAAPTPVEAWAP